MAYVPKQLPEDEQNLFGRTQPTTADTAPGGGGSAGTGGNTAPGVGTSTQFGSNAAKLSDYLKANEGQVGEFGQRVADQLTKGYGDTLGSIDQGYQQFGQQVNSGYAQPNQGLVDQAASNPSEFVKNPNDVSSFKSIYNNQYSGPDSFASSGIYGDLNNQVNKAVENSGLVNSSSGLQTYLNNFMGGGNRTQGMQALDTALLQKSPTARNTIQSAASPYQNLTGYLSNKSQAAENDVAIAKQKANTSQQETRNRFTGEGGVIPTFKNQVESGLAPARQSALDRSDAARSALENGTASDQELSDLGLTGEQYNSALAYRDLINSGGNSGNKGSINLPDFLGFTQQSPDVAINRSNFATPEQYAQSAALAQLTGQDMSSFLNPSDAAQAGKYNSDISDINMGNLELLRQRAAEIPYGPNQENGPINPPSNGGPDNVGTIINPGTGSIIDATTPMIPPIVGDALTDIGDTVLGGGKRDLRPEERNANERNDIQNEIRNLPQDQRAARAREYGYLWNGNSLVSIGGANQFYDPIYGNVA